MIKILVFLAAIMACSFITPAEATVTTVTDRGNILVYSSYTLPNRTNKTVISIYNAGAPSFVIAPPFWYYGDKINADIIWWYTYMVNNGIPFRWGTCKTFPYQTTCLN